MMRPTPSPIRDLVPRLCSRCRLQARRASTLHLARPTRASTSTSTSTTPRLSIAYSPRALLSTTPRLLSASPDIDRPLPNTHYDLFPNTLPNGPPPTGHFPINVRLLRKEFLTLQSKHHPDLAPSSLKAKAETYSAIINDAYKTLSNPLTRAQYLLSLRGVDVANDETLKIEEPDLLMLVLGAREDIEDATDEAEIEKLRDVNEERVRDSEEKLDALFAGDDVDGAKREAVRLRYWVNVRESLDNWEAGKPVVLQH